MKTTSSRPLGQCLIDARLLDKDQLRIALIEQSIHHRQLGETLVEMEFVSEDRLIDALSHQLDIPRLSLNDLEAPAGVTALVPEKLARQYRVFPVKQIAETGELLLAMANPLDPVAIEHLRSSLPGALRLTPAIAGRTEIEQAIDRHYSRKDGLSSLLTRVEQTDALQAASSTSPAVHLIDQLLADAVREHASDIHFEPEAASVRIRYRIDGHLQAVCTVHKRSWASLAGRLKILGNLNIAETRMPQDGHFSQVIGGRPIDFRIASQPTIHGENLVLRVLDRQKGIVPLEQLGLSERDQSLLERMLARPTGLILVTGPTGSGKTTTLYSMLARLDAEHLNIMTLEDPVEYPLPRLRQTSLAEGLKLDFASGVRALLRQDPDVILIGEIRDRETAAMAVRAALTGHQVFATLHATSALNALNRLRELGVETPMLQGNLTGIIAQRLVRRLCPRCRRIQPASVAERQMLGTASVHVPGQCPHCNNRGYRGRLALIEILRIDAELDQHLGNQSPLSHLQATALQNGFQDLSQSGLARVQNGDTTLSELARVVDLSELRP